MEAVKGIKFLARGGGEGWGECCWFCPTAESVRCAVIAVATGVGRATGDQYRPGRGYPPAKLQSRRTESTTLGHESMSGWNIQTETVPFGSNYTTLCCTVQDLTARSSVRHVLSAELLNALPSTKPTKRTYSISNRSFGTTVPFSGSFYTKF